MRGRSAIRLLGFCAAGCATYNPPPPQAPPELAAPAVSAAEARADLELVARRLEEAQRRLNKLDLTGARRLLDEVVVALGPAPAAPEAFRLWLREETARGVAALAEGRREEASARFAELRRIRPDHALDPGEVPPEALELFARSAAPPAPSGARMAVATVPAGATVYLDGRARGTAPLDLELAAGPHFATAFLDGRWAPSLRVDAAGRTAVTLRFGEPPWGPMPPRAGWKDMGPDDGPDRAWYRKWWWWALIGAGTAAAASHRNAGRGQP